MPKEEHFYGEKMRAHVHRALESFPMNMTKKQLIRLCEEYIAANPDIYITPGWFAKWMMDDSWLLQKNGKVKGSKARIWWNAHLQYKNYDRQKLRIT